MRRAPIVLSATVAGTAAVLGFHAHQPAAPKATAAKPAAPPPSPSVTSRAGSRTATGDAISTRYGNAQVSVTVSGGRITKVEALQLQGDDPKSVQISSSAEPVLQASALSKQSAAIDTVSGATYTSMSYQQSLQSALDKLGFQPGVSSQGQQSAPAGG